MALSNPDPTDPLSTPSHAALHTATNGAIAGLESRLGTIEAAVPVTAENIKQARRVSNTWVVPGPVTVSTEASGPLLPLLDNLTPRQVEFEAAQASVLTPPLSGEIWVEFQISGPGNDPNNIVSGTIAKLVIAEGEWFSNVLTKTDFVGVQEQYYYLKVVVTQVGDTGALPEDVGADLTVQLNRLL